MLATSCKSCVLVLWTVLFRVKHTYGTSEDCVDLWGDWDTRRWCGPCEVYFARQLGGIALQSEGSSSAMIGPCLQALLHADGFQIRGLTRNKASPAAQKLQAAGAEMVQGNLSDPSSLKEVCPCCRRAQRLLCP